MSDSSLSFERFLTGSANELAVAAARRVAEQPGSVYNPLLITGRAGLGKTHLLNALARYATSLESERVVHLDSADRIAARLQDAIEEGTLEAFAESFAAFDILLIDDVDRLAGLDDVQAELCVVANQMSVEGRQLVLASRAPLAEASGITLAFVEVATRGLVVDLHPPDPELRRALIDVFAREHGATLPGDLVRALTERDYPDVVSVRAAVSMVIEAAAAEGRDPGIADLASIIDDVEGAAGDGGGGDEFGSFLDDVSRTLAAVVETSPWRRQIAEAILRWEGEGVGTSKLDDALLAESPPDVAGLLGEYTRDATRLLQIRRELESLGMRLTVDDPAKLAEAEAQLAMALATGAPSAASAGEDESIPAGPKVADPWFLNHEKVIVDWVDIDGRIVLETG